MNRPSALHGELDEIVKKLERENQALRSMSGQPDIIKELSD